MTEMLLNWNKDLTEQVDKNRSTPLHFAASLCKDFAASLSEYTVITWMSRTPLIPVLLANPVQLYQQDSEGLYPIHVAASSGAIRTIKYLIEEQPDEIAGLVDFKGRTFLHVAVERGRRNIVEYAHRTRSLARIFNMQDNDGNTAMHIAVRNGNKYIFCILLRNRKNPEKLILLALTHCNASGGCRRADHFQKKQADEAKESEKLTTSTQTLGIGSVLIVTVTFGAILAIPGGYKADDHYNGGTPTLAGSSVISLGAAFMLGMYLVLAPVARWTAIAICVMMMIASLCLFTEPLHAPRVAIAMYVRKGNQDIQRTYIINCGTPNNMHGNYRQVILVDRILRALGPLTNSSGLPLFPQAVTTTATVTTRRSIAGRDDDGGDSAWICCRP
uniref:Ankyrin-like protein n=1 Tax=Oryza sativa subsp. japonica TaxID=39947 RepID=Q6EQB8_ORYSJ|nr:ankyrin-like protein [Oryza sativa Japonica Group]BAD29152.1 ankyrin-like protein [Oryza sativa Japonica Group]